MPPTADQVLLIVGLVAAIAVQLFASKISETFAAVRLSSPALDDGVLRRYRALRAHPAVTGEEPVPPYIPLAPAPPPNTGRPPYVGRQPDEIRLEHHSPRETRCGEAIPPESITSTRNVGLDGRAGVTIFVRSVYHVREEVDGLHQFTYSVEIANEGANPIQLMSRHWQFTDSNGHVEEVKGPGARGIMVKISPGTRLEYSSATYLAAAAGSMQGSFQFEELSDTDDDGVAAPLRPVAAFNGWVSRLALSRDGRAETVPCVESSSEQGKLPLTSVGVAHRVGAGAMVNYDARQSDPDMGKFAFTISVTVSNAREEAVALLGYEWTITNGHGVTEYKMGEGLGGEF